MAEKHWRNKGRPAEHRGAFFTKRKEDEMDKEQALKIIKLLSAIETAGVLANPRMPDYLPEQLNGIVEELSTQILTK